MSISRGYQESFATEPRSSPCSLYTEKEMYYPKIQTGNEFKASLREAENVYENIHDENHMATMDVRIKVTEDIIRERDHFGDLVKSDIQFSKSDEHHHVNKS